ncbi:MAG: SDR family oxidoreductase [Candidatus Velthaea sp.]
MRKIRRFATAALGAASVAAGLGLLRPRARSASFAGRIALVTGGSRGLGFVLAQLLARAGAEVTICGRSSESLERARTALEAEGLAVTTYACDVRDRVECAALISRVLERSGRIDILVNNAGTIEVGPILEATLDDYREAMETHFWGPLYLSLEVLPSMRARHAGHIVNVASIGGLVGVPHLAPYSASKFAEVGFSQALAAEVAADGIVVTAVCPGLMYTGSRDNAAFKGRNRAEYTWLTPADANPLLAVSPLRAAKRILRGIARRETHVTIGALPKLAKTMNAIFPETTARLLALSARLLPAPGGIETARRTGAESHSLVARRTNR